MLLIEHTVKTKASPESVWALWEDVKNWNTWDQGLDFSVILGPFKEGTEGYLKPKGGPVLKTVLGKVEPLKFFQDRAKLFGCTICMNHTLRKEGDDLYVTHRVEMKGPLKLFYRFVLGQKIAENLPHEMQVLVNCAENRLG